MSATLTVHTPGSHRISREQVLDLAPPESMGPRHKPVPHSELLIALTKVVDAYGFAIDREEYAFARKGHHFFGVMELDVKPGEEGRPMASAGFKRNGTSVSIGLRNSTNQNIGIGLVGGKRAWICDNLALSGDVLALKRKNTTGLDNLKALVHDGFGRVLDQVRDVDTSMRRLEVMALTDTEAKAAIFDIFSEGALPPTWFPRVNAYYFTKSTRPEDIAPRSMLGVYGAVTRSIRETENAARRFEATTRVGRHFGIGVTNGGNGV